MAEFIDSSLLSAGQWVHMVVAWDGSLASTAGLKTYINGVEVTSYVAGGLGSGSHTTDAGQLLHIAHNQTCNSLSGCGYFNGKLDDVRIYNRALSPTEVQQLYKLGTVIIHPN
jgi:concanavalin A-like lectin/glucanase superfamily protein